MVLREPLLILVHSKGLQTQILRRDRVITKEQIKLDRDAGTGWGSFYLQLHCFHTMRERGPRVTSYYRVSREEYQGFF